MEHFSKAEQRENEMKKMRIMRNMRNMSFEDTRLAEWDWFLDEKTPKMTPENSPNKPAPAR